MDQDFRLRVWGLGSRGSQLALQDCKKGWVLGPEDKPIANSKTPVAVVAVD